MKNNKTTINIIILAVITMLFMISDIYEGLEKSSATYGVIIMGVVFRNQIVDKNDKTNNMLLNAMFSVMSIVAFIVFVFKSFYIEWSSFSLHDWITYVISIHTIIFCLYIYNRNIINIDAKHLDNKVY